MIKTQLTQIIRAGLPPAGAPQELPALEGSDWDALLAAAGKHGVTPLLYGALKAAGTLDAAPAAARIALRAEYAHIWAENTLVLNELAQLIDLLCTRHQIPVVLLKGVALLHTLYPDPGWRPLSDVDLLVPQAHAAAAAALLQANGYAPTLEMQPGMAHRYGNEQAFARQTGMRVHVDLHWQLYSRRYFRRRRALDWHWAQTAEVKVADQAARVFRPEAQLLHLCAHLMLHHRHQARLLWTYDIARLLGRDVLDWDAVLAVAREFALLPALQAALRQVSEEWGVAPPPAVMAAQLPWRDRIAFAASTARRAETRLVLDAITSADVRTTVGLWWSVLFPTPAYMRERYEIADMRRLPLYYAYRVTAGACRTVRGAFLNLAR